MANLDDRWFAGSDDLPEIIAESLEAASLGQPLEEVLKKQGWKGAPVAGVGLELAPDNRKVLRGQFYLRGRLSSDPVIVQASKLWEKTAKDITAHFTLPEGGAFDFAGGTLASEYLSSENVPLACAKGQQVLLPTDWPACGIQDFCIRLVATLDRSANGRRGIPTFRYTLLFFPFSADDMEAQNEGGGTIMAGWPGIKILEGSADFFPRAPEGGWGCPIYPILCTGTPFAEMPNLPSGEELRYVIGAVLGSARQPTSCTSFATMRRRWDVILSGDDEVLDVLPHIRWPIPPAPASTNGMICIQYMLEFITHHTHR